jgi:hypothetical protein
MAFDSLRYCLVSVTQGFTGRTIFIQHKASVPWTQAMAVFPSSGAPRVLNCNHTLFIALKPETLPDTL